MSELEFARARLRDALSDVLRLEGEERVRRAYEHGFGAGLKAQMVAADRVSYRRGYLAGYAAASRGARALPDGARTGRPRKTTCGVA